LTPAVPFDKATATVTVDADPATAFRIFTEETDLWWRRGVRFRVGGRNPGDVLFETHLGGRLLESFETASGTRVIEMGRITAWEPPARFCFEWRASNFAPEEKTHVEVLFQPVRTGTSVTVHHRGWSHLRADHPVRHGEAGAQFIRRTAIWWGDQLTAFRERIANVTH
jgi:uncharacterized protein YndB with AHSA1/START domain